MPDTLKFHGPVPNEEQRPDVPRRVADHPNDAPANDHKQPSSTSELLVLIIDDDRDTAQAAALRLRGAGHQVLLQHDGISGLARAIEMRPDIILLDLHMPTTDGSTTLRWLREHSATAQIPIVVFSADESMRPRAGLMGASHFLGKPYDADKLVEEVQAVAARGAKGNRHERGFNVEILNKRLQQDVNRVQKSLGQVLAVLEKVYSNSTDINPPVSRERLKSRKRDRT